MWMLLRVEGRIVLPLSHRTLVIVFRCLFAFAIQRVSNHTQATDQGHFFDTFKRFLHVCLPCHRNRKRERQGTARIEPAGYGKIAHCRSCGRNSNPVDFVFESSAVFAR